MVRHGPAAGGGGRRSRGVARQGRGGGRRGIGQRAFQVEAAVARGDHRAFDHILQFPHIAGPVIPFEEHKRGVGQTADRPLVPRRQLAHGAPVGGEESGHVLFGDGLPGGDGLVTGLRAIAAATAACSPMTFSTTP